MEELVAGSPDITLIDHPFVRESGLERPGRADAPDDRLPALPRAGLPGRAEAPRAGRVGSTTGRSPARQRRPPDSRRARRGTLDAAGGRALHRAAAAGGRVSRGGAPRRDDDHAADRFRHVPGRPRPRREAARHPGLLPGAELGQPDQQGPAARRRPTRCSSGTTSRSGRRSSCTAFRPESVVVTGAPAYDHWFDWQPGLTREEFGAAAGLDPSRPIVLYAGSSEFIAPDEPAFVRRWVEAVRAQGGSLADAGLLVRPHPLAAFGLPRAPDRRPAGLGLAGVTGSSRSPARRGRTTSTRSTTRDAVVGINTSAQIEAAIVGRPVYTILDDEFAETQAGHAPLPLPRRRGVRAPPCRRDARGARRAAAAGRGRRGPG